MNTRIKTGAIPNLPPHVAKAVRAATAAPDDSKAILEAFRGWFAIHISNENCMNTIVDVFTAMREELEDDDTMLPMIRAARAKEGNK